MRNYWVRGVGNKTGPIDYIEQPVPLLKGGNFNENQKIESNYLGIEFRVGGLGIIRPDSFLRISEL